MPIDIDQFWEQLKGMTVEEIQEQLAAGTSTPDERRAARLYFEAWGQGFQRGNRQASLTKMPGPNPVKEILQQWPSPDVERARETGSPGTSFKGWGESFKGWGPSQGDDGISAQGQGEVSLDTKVGASFDAEVIRGTTLGQLIEAPAEAELTREALIKLQDTLKGTVPQDYEHSDMPNAEKLPINTREYDTLMGLVDASVSLSKPKLWPEGSSAF